jgi:hypothetical protein
MAEENRIIVANITWNDSGWRNIYVNPRAGHEYARKHPGHESLNFDFNKKGVDTDEDVYGYFKWTHRPRQLGANGLIIFYSRNLETGKGEIVGIYGNAKILEKDRKVEWKGFHENYLDLTISAKKHLSLLFPKPLDSGKYSGGKRLVPQGGYTYKTLDFAEKIILDEIKELERAGIRLDEFKKLKDIYKFLTGKDYSGKKVVEDDDSKEQEELLPLITSQSKQDIIEELERVKPQTPELVEFHGKQYKRDNKTIVQLKRLRDFKCQICGTFIQKKDNTPYIEAAHITEKRHKGPEAPDNILILCPNHHKEFDLGNKIIIEKSTEKIVFELNGRKHELSLELK